ncbi:MAG: anaerobic ribonucleoside-triphosphate reductase, partial [Candidatus Riflebacteria bacterium]
QAGTSQAPYYTNSSQLPADYAGDIFDLMTHQERLQGKYTGGTVLHLYLGERIADAESCKRLVQKSLTQFRLPYITITPTFSICPEHGYISGEHQFCPKCDETAADDNNRTECEVWTRVMGYFRPVSQFNAGKKSEYKERVTLNSQEVIRQVV